MNRGKESHAFAQIARGTLTVTVLWAVCWLMPGCGGTSTPSTQAPGELVAITINPPTALLPLASNRQLQALGVLSNGTQQDITSQVTWTVSSTPSVTDFVKITPAGLASGSALGTSVVSATLGPVVGLLQLTVNADGYSSRATAILPAVTNQTQVDAAYQPISKFKSGEVYTVQVLNLDADLTSTVLPVQTALIASIPMPAGFVPNAAAASQTSLKVAVISYTSPEVIVIDASNDPTDLASNTVLATFKSPVTTSVFFQGRPCMICAAAVDPVTDDLILSTAQGYYAMDLTSGTFTAMLGTPAAQPAASFAINPVFTSAAGAAPYLLSPIVAQDSTGAALQTLQLTNENISTNSLIGITTPTAAVINTFANQGAVVDGSANGQALLDLKNPNNPITTTVQNLGVCADQVPSFDMVALGIGVGLDPTTVSPTLFLSQHSGSCVGFEIWPAAQTGFPLNPAFINYGYGLMPPTPDGQIFVNGVDPNEIAAFTSIANKKNYGVLVSADQTWVAKIDFANVLSASNQFSGFLLPAGILISPATLDAGVAGAPVVYLPTTGVVALSANSIDFGTQLVGSASVPGTITLTNTSIVNPLNITQIAIQGSDTSEFTQTNNCIDSAGLPPKGTCTITVIFTPTAKGMRSAVLSITDDGGNSPQKVALAGTGN